MRDLLEANSFEVEEAMDAAAAVQTLRDREFEVVLTDLMLPDGDGLEVLRAARSRPYEPEVLVITAYGTIDSAVEAVRGGRIRLPHKADCHAEASAHGGQGHGAAHPEARGERAAQRGPGSATPRRTSWPKAGECAA